MKESTGCEGLSISGDSSVVFESCTVRNFGTAINIDEHAKVEFNNSKIENCNNGMIILDDDVKVSFKDSSISDFLTYGILRYSEKVDKDFQKNLDVDNADELKR